MYAFSTGKFQEIIIRAIEKIRNIFIEKKK